MGGPETWKTNPRWQTTVMFKNWRNCYVFATARPILMKFDNVMHLRLPRLVIC